MAVPSVDADAVRVVNAVAILGPEQSWKCAACGEGVTPGSEALAHVKAAGRVVPVLVHADCASALLHVATWGDHRQRELETGSKSMGAARTALEEAIHYWERS